jgi:hypothetical protein
MSIAVLFEQVSRAMIAEAEHDMSAVKSESEWDTFGHGEVATLQASLKSRGDDLVAFLEDTSYLSLWYRLATKLIEFQGLTRGEYKQAKNCWTIAMQRAHAILLLWDSIRIKFEEIEEELESSEMIVVASSIEAKLRALENFLPICNRYSGSGYPQKVFECTQKKPRQVSHAYQQLQENASILEVNRFRG